MRRRDAGTTGRGGVGGAMAGFRLSIAGMAGLVALAALGLVSLRFPSVRWLMAGATVTLGLHLTAVLGAVHSRGPDRAFWVGFALFGLTYLLLVDWDWIGARIGQDLTAGLDEFAETLVDDPGPTPVGPAARNPGVDLADRSVKVGNVLRLSRMFLSLAFALLGGLIGRALSARPVDDRTGPPRAVSSP